MRERADRYRAIGKPKTEASERTIPLIPMLREWKAECPPGELVFPNGDGNVEFHVNIIERGLRPTMIEAGVTSRVLDKDGKPQRAKDGKPLVEAKYTGLHALRHFYASLCINRNGGWELPPFRQ